MNKRGRFLLTALMIICGIITLPAEDVNRQEDEQEDQLLENLIESLDVTLEELAPEQAGTVRLREIRVVVHGSTTREWVLSRLLFKKDVIYSESEWLRLSQKQTDYFLETTLFYSVKIYIHPSETPGDFIGFIELVDGFMYAFNFWPWDFSVAFKHVLNGNERLELTVGLNTQKISWSHPVVGGTPFSYEVSAGHQAVYHPHGWLENSFIADTKIYASLGPVLDIGFEGGYRYFTFPKSSWLEPDLKSQEVAQRKAVLGLSDPGHAGTLGIFADLWPSYRFMNPFGYSLSMSGGAIISSYGDTSWYAKASGLIFLRPIEKLVFALGISGETSPGAPAVLWPDIAVYRSSHLLEKGPTLVRGFFQVTSASLLSFPLGFTSMTINPFAYFETAETFDKITNFSFNELTQSAGAAVAIGFTIPINLYFSFGVKSSINPEPGLGFLFSVDLYLY